MRIGELSHQSGVSRRALRYYEEQGLLVPQRGCNGYREYADDAALIVSQIQRLYLSGLNSEAIRRYLPCARGQTPQLEMCAELRAHLLSRAAALDDDAQTAARQRDVLLGHLA
ncbi:MerR family DNA-binding transcriptional regulator [Cryobacterium frigoriphilum]|uniref:MerR family DNA-binding transcriptional regulator n=1 Tax=Cryobacterium frigoriphilum TaxID=1259150 RepID=A0A4R8ZZM3_9MICO|nr:MerR family DNA-binding transcriptional regulator [Cryobacterium frigoriphilum]